MKLAIIVLALAGTLAVAANPPAHPLDLQSDKRLGYVTLTSDLVFTDGRLVLTVGAFNKGTVPVDLGPASLTITTPSGKPVALASLAQLEDETRVALGAKPANHPDEYAQVSTMQRPMDVTASGETDVSGYTGSETLTSTISKQRVKKGEVASAEKLEATLASLRAGLLQGVKVEPRGAAGGQVVTQAIKFARGEPRKLKVAIAFAGEDHEFEFDVPK